MNRITLCFICLCLAVLPGCNIAGKTNRKPPVRISVNVWPGFAHVFLAQEKGFFKKNNVDVEIVLKQSTPESFKLFKDGEVDGCFDTLPDVVLMNAQGRVAKIVSVVDSSDTGDVIISRPDIKTLKDLENKTVSFEGVNTFSHIFVLKAIESAGLKEIDLKFADVNAHDVLKALKEGKIDAGHTWQPTKSEALAAGYKVLTKAGDFPGIIIDVLSFSPEIINKRPDDVRAIVKSLFEAEDYLSANPDESINIMSQKMGMSSKDMKTGLEGIRRASLQENISLLTDPKSSVHESGKFISDFYLKRGQFSLIPDMTEVLDEKFVNDLGKK